jgi:hypothetical protein
LLGVTASIGALNAGFGSFHGAYRSRAEVVLAASVGFTAPKELEATAARIVRVDTEKVREPASVTHARREAERLGQELDRIIAAIRAGMDPVLTPDATRSIQAERVAGGAPQFLPGRSRRSRGTAPHWAAPRVDGQGRL